MEERIGNCFLNLEGVSIFEKQYSKTKQELIATIKTLVANGSYSDYGGWPTIHVKCHYEKDYIQASLKECWENFVIVYTNNKILINNFKSYNWQWKDGDDKHLRYPGFTHLVEIPYEDIVLDDLYIIASGVEYFN